MNRSETRQYLEDLAASRDMGLISGWEASRRADAMLLRSDLATFDLVDFLDQKGFAPQRTARVMGEFASAVREAFHTEYGVYPSKRLQLINGEYRPVLFYLETDRDLIESVFEDMFVGAVV